jgi:hypothetical protein
MVELLDRDRRVVFRSRIAAAISLTPNSMSDPMLHHTTRALVFSLAIAVGTFASSPLLAQTAAKPSAQTKTPPKGKAPARPAPKTPAPAAAKPAAPAPAAKPVAQDLRMKTVYTAGDLKTETVTSIKGMRERFEFADMLLLKQHDLKRTVQISRAANTYLLIPDGAASTVPAVAPVAATAPQKPGVVTVTTTIVDTGERKPLFGYEGRHVKTTIDKQPTPGACDPGKQHIEMDGWYVDMPAIPQPVQDTTAPAAPPAATGCVDEIKATQNGDPKVLGFPVSYSTTITGEDGKPNLVAMEITELEVTTLDAALFDIPPGLMEAGNIGALSKAVSDASEAKLAQALTAPATEVQKTPGVVLIGVPEVINKTTQQVDTRALRARLVADLVAAKINAAPLAGSPTEVAQLATAHGYDYVLVAEVTDLKASKGGGIGGVLKAASKVTGGATATQDPTEAAVALKLVQPDGKARLSTTVKGKDGGFDMKTGLGVAKFAGTMYMNMMTGKMMMNALNASMAGNLGGMGMLGNPGLMNVQTRGLGTVPGMRMGIDPTAGAASFLMQQAMAGDAAASAAAGPGPSFDAALSEAFEQAAKTVSESLKKADQKKK